MAQIAYITSAGQAAIADARFNGYKIAIVRYKIGDTLITESSASVIRNYTTLPGTIVYDSGNNPTDNTLTYARTDNNGIVISVYLNSSIGDFTMGSVGLYLDDGTLFAILALEETYNKTKNSGSVAGNIIMFPFTFVITVADVLDLEITPEGVASLPTVATEASLPSYNLAPYTAYYVQNLSGTGNPAIACRTSSSWQYVLSSNHNAFENWLKVDSSSFDTTALDGNTVYFNTVTSLWTNLDGDGVEQKLYGIRQGNGVRVGGFYYKQNAFITGSDYYVNTYPQLGQLTVRSSKYYIGTALNNSLLKLSPSYSDATFEGDKIIHYDAAVDSSGNITLTTDDWGKYPDSYTNGLKISFICPITVGDNVKIRIGSLNQVYLTKRVISPLGYGTKLASGDIILGTLVEAIYVSTDEGFRCTSGIRASTTTLGVQLLKPNRNILLNGDFNVFQRGISFTSVADQTYTADRWLYAKGGAVVHDISITSDVPNSTQAGAVLNSSLLLDCQTVDTSLASLDFAAIEQRIEGRNYQIIAQKQFTVSFWVKATKTGIYCVYAKNGSADKSCVREYTVYNSDTWEFKTITFPASPSAGIWDYGTGLGMFFGFLLHGGAGLTTANEGVWQDGGYLGTVNQVNASDSTSNNFKIAAVQLEEGPVYTKFDRRMLQEELALCQRYYEMLGGQSNNEDICSGYSPNTTHGDGVVTFKVEKRATPTITFSGGTLFRFNNATSNYRSSAVAAVNQTTKTFIISLTISGVSPNSGGVIDTYDATGKVFIDAEL